MMERTINRIIVACLACIVLVLGFQCGQRWRCEQRSCERGAAVYLDKTCICAEVPK